MSALCLQDLSKMFPYWEVYHKENNVTLENNILSSIFCCRTSANGANSFKTLVPTSVLNELSKRNFYPCKRRMETENGKRRR